MKKTGIPWRSPLSDSKGMTLVEIAIVLVLVGVIIGIGAGMVGPLTKRIKISETKETVNAAIESLVGFVTTNRRLPCEINDNNGFCSTVGDEFTSAIRTTNDVFGRPLQYVYDNSLTTAGNVCGKKTTLLTVRMCGNAGCTVFTDSQNVAFMVLSGGVNYNNQTRGTQGITAATVVNIYEPDVAGIDNYATDMNRPEEFDDIVKWVTLNELKTKIGCQGAPMKILNNELPPGTVGSPYPSATVGAVLTFSIEGGATPVTYGWCVESSTLVPLPAGLNFSSVVPVRVSPNTCNSTNPLAEGGWVSAAALSISGTPSAGTSGAYGFTLYVRDNNDATGSNDNVASKSFVITINP